MIRDLMLRIGMVGLAVCLLVSFTGCPLNFVYIPDRALEQVLRHAANKPLGYLTERDLLGVVELNAAGWDIRNLEGLEACRNLTWLNLRSNKIQSISALTGLVNLRYLHLGDNIITEISPLAGLLFLEELLLFGEANEIFDFGPLVANALAGGLRDGDIVILPTKTTLLADQLTIQDYFLDHYNALVDAGTVVVFAEADGTEIEF